MQNPPSHADNTAPAMAAGLTVVAISSLGDIDPNEWDALVPDAHPFLLHAFLLALEESRSVGADTGWEPLYLTARTQEGALVAALPNYVKYNSYGEYVFDHAWANGFERAGGHYYPKFLTAIPFTPVPGPRLLSREQNPQLAGAMGAALTELAQNNDISSAHINFLSDADRAVLDAQGWMIRKGVQFHWHNHGYQQFDDFLAALSSRKRKNIRKERKCLADDGVRFLQLTGNDITQQHWDKFYEFYLATIDKKWGGAYLTRGFFDRIGQHLADKILLIMAEQDGDIIAGALNFIGHDALYGRNWGCLRELPNLHFETCYYQAIDFAIRTGLSRVEAGAQGIHKVQRGYVPVITYSAHWIGHEAFSSAVQRFLEQENRLVEDEARIITQHSPYRTPDPS